MTDIKRIEKGLYWDRALSLVEGCSPVSEGCAHCWAATASHMRENNPNEKVSARHKELTGSNGKWTGKIRLMWEDLDKVTPRQEPKTYSVWNDLFHPLVQYEFQIRAFEAMAVASQHTYLILTKRPDLMRKFFRSIEHWLHIGPNVWFGVSVELAKYAWRIQELLKIKGNLFVNFEPLLGPISIIDYCADPQFGGEGIDWVIVGGESGSDARPMHPEWVRSIREQCQEAMVPFFFKQWGEYCPDDFDFVWPSGSTPKRKWVHIDGESYDYAYPYNCIQMMRVGKKVAGRMLDGKVWNELGW